MFKRHNGTAFLDIETIKRYDGSKWVECESAKRWDGSGWTEVWSNIKGDRLFTSSGTLSANFKLEEREKDSLAVIETTVVTFPVIPEDMGGIRKRLFFCTAQNDNKIYEYGLKAKAIINTSRKFSNTPLAVGGSDGYLVAYLAPQGLMTFNPDTLEPITYGETVSYETIYGIDGISDGTIMMSLSQLDGDESNWKYADIINVSAEPSVGGIYSQSTYTAYGLGGCVSRWFSYSGFMIQEMPKPVSNTITFINRVNTSPNRVLRMGGVK